MLRNRSFSSNGSNTSQSPMGSSGRKIPLAECRYGKEEMLSLYPNPVIYPVSIANLPTIVRPNCIQPLAFIPLTEEEQVSNDLLYYVFCCKGHLLIFKASC